MRWRDWFNPPDIVSTIVAGAVLAGLMAFVAWVKPAVVPYLPAFAVCSGIFVATVVLVSVIRHTRRLRKLPQLQEVQFGWPKHVAYDDTPHVHKWYVPVLLNPATAEQSYEQCRVELHFIDRRGYSREQLHMRCQADDPSGEARFTLRRGEAPKMIPIAIRTEGRGWNQLAEWEARMTDMEYLVHQRPFPLPPDTYQFRLHVRHLDKHWESPIYTLAVPKPNISNGSFILSREDA